MSDTARILLIQGMAAAKAGAKHDAHYYLERLLLSEPDECQLVEAWLWLSEVSDDPEEKRKYLEYVIGYEPWNPRARRGLAILNGKLNPNDMINPDRLSALTTETQDAGTRRYVCQQCGGRMTFAADNNGLTCEYCGHRLTLLQALDEGSAVEEHEFVIALATAQGHTRPMAMRSFACQGCGATLLLGPDVLSLSCPYCASAHVLELPEAKELIPPEAIIPMALTQEQACHAFGNWLQEKGLRREAYTNPPSGLYLPMWTFDVGGEVQWRGTTSHLEPDQRLQLHIDLVPSSGGVPIFYNDVLVPASHTLPAKLTEEVGNFDLTQLQPYDPGYLAGWPAEVYQVAVAEASLVARRRAWEQARFSLTSNHPDLEDVREMRVSSAGLVILSYKLILLPFWLGRYHYRGSQYSVVINGQKGTVRGEVPRGKLQRFLTNLLDEE